MKLSCVNGPPGTGLPPDEARKARKAAYRNTARTKVRASGVRSFIATDGEGIGSGRDHKYVLLACGSNLLENPDGINWWEAFHFWYYENFQHNPFAIYAGFFLGYDFAQLFKTLPEPRARMLLTKEGIKARERKASGDNRIPFTVGCHAPDGSRWQFDLLPPMRRLKLRPKLCDCPTESCPPKRIRVNGKLQDNPKWRGCPKPLPWMFINDSGPFWQCSLLAAIDPKNWSDPIATDEEYAIILRGKERRSTHKLDDDMREYTRLENEIMSRLMSRLNDGLVAAGVRLPSDAWYGPGQAAQKWMYQQPGIIKRNDSQVALRARKAAQATYYGGWFEIHAHGILPGITYEYDINSAYPYIMANLPCFEHGTWTSGTGKPGKLRAGNYRIVHAELNSQSSITGPMMHRNKQGRITRPQNSSGWHWQHEIDAAISVPGLVKEITYHEWIEYTPCDCEPPLEGLADLYEQRLKVDKNSAHGKALKLIYNSVYGKFAQSVGEPVFGSSIYASLITAGCRAMILDAIATHPNGLKALVMVATDGVYFRRLHPGLEEHASKKLGDWSGGECTSRKCARKHDCGEKADLTLFKPGVYWDDETRKAIENGESPKLKSRGVSSKYLATVIADADDMFRQWEPGKVRMIPPGGFPAVKFRSDFSMITPIQALQWGRWYQAGQITNGVELEQSSNPVSKRSAWYLVWDEEMQVYRSENYRQGSELESTPYDKRFGSEDEPLTEMDDDFLGMTPDGPVMMLLRNAMTL